MLCVVICFGCNNQPSTQDKSVEKKRMGVSFNKLYTSGKLMVAYTDDSDSLWTNEEWANAIKSKMRINAEYSDILLFYGIEHTPDVSKFGWDYPEEYDKWMVAGYWRMNYTKFCYGGLKEDGNFKICKEYE